MSSTHLCALLLVMIAMAPGIGIIAYGGLPIRDNAIALLVMMPVAFAATWTVIDRLILRPIERKASALGPERGGKLAPVTSPDDRSRFDEFPGALDRAEESAQQWPGEATPSLALLKRSEQRYRGLYDSIQDGILMTDIPGQILDCNQKFADMLGYTKQELLQLTNQQITPEKWRRRDGGMLRYQVFVNGYSEEYEKEHTAKNGKTIPIAAKVWLIRDDQGNPKALWGIMRDITSRKQAEAELRESEEKYRSIVETANEGIWVADSGLRTVFMNHRMADMLGRSVEECRESGFEDFLGDGQKGQLAAALNELGSGRRVQREILLRRSDGNLRWALVNASPLADAGGRVTSYMGIYTDITDRKRAEAEMERLNVELARNIKHLEAANKELEAFSYSVSHDLRAPLRAINGFSTVVLDDYADRLDDEGRRCLNIIASSAQKMGDLINDLLAFSRLGRQSLSVSDIDMRALVEAVCAQSEAEAPARGLVFRVDHLPPARGDATMVRQVLVNLVSNAVKFTRPRETAIIEIGTTSEHGETAYYIRDNGVGFDMRYYDKIFGVFQRLHRDEEFEGTGVGLAIVQRVILRHGGRVWAESKVGEGTTFHFTLPA